MNILIVGNGAREHAFAGEITKSRSNRLRNSSPDVGIFSLNANYGLSAISKALMLIFQILSASKKLY